MDALLANTSPPHATPVDYSAEWFDLEYGTNMIPRVNLYTITVTTTPPTPPGGPPPTPTVETTVSLVWQSPSTQTLPDGTTIVTTVTMANEAGNQIIQYATIGTNYGLVEAVAGGAGRRVYGAMLFSVAYVDLKLQDLESIAHHEARHANQHIWMKPHTISTDSRPEWVFLETVPFRPAREYFMETDSECVELCQNGSWRYLKNKSYFQSAYINALGVYTTRAAGNIKGAMKTILQEIYQDVPFMEMKYRPFPGYEYDWIIRAPE